MPAPDTHYRVAGTWKRIKTIYFRTGGVWKAVKNAYYRVSGVWKKIYQNRVPVNLTISASTNNYNAFTSAGSPTDTRPHDVVVTINTGVVVGSTSTATASFQTGGSWPAGSTFTIVNNGSIIGKGGAGGAGGSTGAGAAGSAGGNAVEFHNSLSAVTINNTSGNVFGGGGGGGGGGGLTTNSGSLWAGGGGGGGGRGETSTAGAAAGSADVGAGMTLDQSGTSGGTGSVGGGAGSGGLGWHYSRFVDGGEDPDFTEELDGGNAGAGGDYGAAGATGSTSSVVNGSLRTPWATYAGGAGGAAGKAVNLNGVTIVWTAGNNSTQVKGAVS